MDKQLVQDYDTVTGKFQVRLKRVKGFLRTNWKVIAFFVAIACVAGYFIMSNATAIPTSLNLTAAVKFEYNDHTMYEVIPETIGHINALKDLRDNKNQNWIFWKAIPAKPSSGVYIIINNDSKLDFLEIMNKNGIQKIKELYHVEIVLKPKYENVDTCVKSNSASPRVHVTDPVIGNSAWKNNTRSEDVAKNFGRQTFNFTDILTKHYLQQILKSIFDTLNLQSETKLHQLALNLLDFSHLPEIVKDYPEANTALEDLAFAQLFPDDRDFILDRLKGLDLCDPNEPNPLNPHLKAVKELIRTQYQMKNFTVEGRLKPPYSIWEKCQRKLDIFEKTCDVISITVIVNSVDECYEVQKTIQRAYKMVPGTFKDLIQGTQEDSLRSFHTLKSCFLGPYGKNIEIQVRTVEMNEVDKANHWTYKENHHIFGDLRK